MYGWLFECIRGLFNFYKAIRTFPIFFINSFLNRWLLNEKSQKRMSRSLTALWYHFAYAEHSPPFQQIFMPTLQTGNYPSHHHPCSSKHLLYWLFLTLQKISILLPCSQQTLIPYFLGGLECKGRAVTFLGTWKVTNF